MRLPPGDTQLVQVVDAAFADASRRAGKRLICRPGCTHCCYGTFAINELDALRLQGGMIELREEDRLTAEAVEHRARGWVAEYGAGFPGDLKMGRLGTSETERERFEDFANDAACPALDRMTGRCDVYKWRPMTCRVYGPPVRSANADGDEGLGHCELCFPGSMPEEVAACEMVVPHEAEAKLLEEMGAEHETIVALALLR